MLKRIKRPPVNRKRLTHFSPHQEHTIVLLDAFKALDPQSVTDIGPVNALGRYLGYTSEMPVITLVSDMIASVDINIGTYYHNTDHNGMPWVHASASYKDYKGYKLPWTVTTGERPTMYYQSRHLHVAVAVCFLTICLRTDKQLWLPDQEPPPTPPSSLPRLKRIKRGGTRN